jgi:hypothetical protein
VQPTQRPIRRRETTRQVFLALCLFAGIGMAVGARADFERVQRLGDIEARFVLEIATQAAGEPERIDIRLSGEVLKLEVIGPSNLEVSAPEPIGKTKNWLFSRIRPDKVTLLQDGRRRWLGTFRVEPDRPSPASLQLAPLKVQTGSVARIVEWPPLSVNVVTSIQRVSPDELIEETPLQPYEGWQESSFRVPLWGAATLLAVGFLTIGYVRYRQMRRARLEQPAPWMRRRLAELRAQNLGSPERIARFYGDLADLLRHYVERRYALPAPTRTTREFLGDIQISAALAENQRELLERFLGRCDLVKFARDTPSLADCHAAIDLVLGFVDESARAKVAQNNG